MSRRLILTLIAGIGAAALPIGLLADGNATTQPDAGATTQPSTDAPTTRPDAPAGPAQQPGGLQQHVVVSPAGVMITTTGGMSAGPGQISDTHITMTVNGGGVSNVTVQTSSTNAPATQPADANAPATQPAGNGG